MSTFFLQGFWHFLQAPGHIIVLFGLGLFLGQQGGRGMRVGVSAFVLATLTGLVLTQVVIPGGRLDIVLLTLAAIIGGLLALKLELPAWFVGLLAGAAGILIGIDSAPSLIPGMKAMKVYAALAGSAASTALVVVLLALPALLLRLPLQGIILRVLGSWVVASALMVLALMFAPH